MNQILDALDPEQREVALALDTPVAVLAGAGTGKTRAITHRVAYAVSQGRYDPRSVLAVTFTTRAAGEMKTRLAQLGIRTTSARTIHAAALRQCRFFWPEAYGSEFPQLAENTFAIVARAANQILGNVETALIRDLETEISWAKSNNVEPESYPQLGAHREIPGADSEQIAQIMILYEKAKQAQGLVDFHDLLLCNAALLNERPEIADRIRAQYQHFVVDEYQDVSAIQHALIGLWVAGRTDICVVGDPNQAIHSFAGADPKFLRSFAREHPNATTIRLVRNYRSSPEILQVANHVLRPPAEQRLIATQVSGEYPILAASATATNEAAAVADWIVQRHLAGTPWSELAVLYRINAASPLFEAALDERKVPYTVRGTERFYERGEVRQAIAEYLKASEAEPKSSATEAMSSALAALRWQPEAPNVAGRQRERWESLNALKQMIDEVVKQHPGLNACEGANWLKERADWQASPVADAVTLSTMHAAKGLEWNDVAVVGVREGLIPFSLATDAAEIAEERRLLYVALTRARKALRISWNFITQGGKQQRSRFLSGLANTKQASNTATATKQKSVRSTLCRACGGQLTTAAERKMRLHGGCELPIDQALFEELRRWRKETAEEAKVPAFVVFTDATLFAIAEDKPADEAGLLRLPGVGKTKVERYGKALLTVLNQYRQ